MTLDKMRNFLKTMDRFINIEDYLTLYQLIESIQPRIIVEMGTALGISGVVMLKATSRAKLITIDNLQDGLTEENWGKHLPPEVIKIWGNAEEVLPRVLEEYKPDLVFLDDGHSYEVISINLQQCREARVKHVIVHDAGSPEVRRAILEVDPKATIMKGNKGVALLKHVEA